MNVNNFFANFRLMTDVKLEDFYERDFSSRVGKSVKRTLGLQKSK